MSSKGLGKPLTIDLVFTKTKSDSLQNIKNLNLWGNDLEDLRLIQKMPNLEVVSLSVNRINSLRDFATCQKLQQLYLRKNCVSDLRQIRHLIKLPSLKVLWLHDNPCAQIQNYRAIVIKYLPNLMKLDNNPITPQERQASQTADFGISSFNSDINQNLQPVANNSNHITQNASIYQQEKYQKQSNYQYQKAPNYEQKMPIKEIPNRPIYGQDKWGKNKNSSRAKQSSLNAPTQQIGRNQNILMAVLSLMRELDQGSLEIIKREADNMMNQ